MESFRILVEVPGGPESFQTVWKISRQSGKFPDDVESSQLVQKVFQIVWNFFDSVESFQIVWRLSSRSGKFPDGLESFLIV